MQAYPTYTFTFNSQLDYPKPHLHYPWVPGNPSVSTVRSPYVTSRLPYDAERQIRLVPTQVILRYFKPEVSCFLFHLTVLREEKDKGKRGKVLKTLSPRACTHGLPYTHFLTYILLYLSLWTFPSFEIGRPNPIPIHNHSIKFNHGQIAL